MSKPFLFMSALIPASPFGQGIGSVVCPLCGDEYQHAGDPRTIPGNDNYEAGWPGRGDLLVIPFRGECGHRWELCFGFHKGSSHVFARSADGADIDIERIIQLSEKWRYSAVRRWENQGAIRPITDKQKAYIRNAQAKNHPAVAELIELINGHWSMSGLDDWLCADGMFVIGCLTGQFKHK